MADVPELSNRSGRLIYHCSLVADWQAARSAQAGQRHQADQADQAAGEYRVSSLGRTLEQEGFVHASYAGQVSGVLQRFYADVTAPICLLVIDPEKLGAPVIAENLTGGRELFPHIYGPVPVSAVVEVIPLVRDGQAGWRSPVG